LSAGIAATVGPLVVMNMLVGLCMKPRLIGPEASMTVSKAA
jgi:hypothetical protein